MEQQQSPAPVPLLQPVPELQPELLPQREGAEGGLSSSARFGLGAGGLLLCGAILAGVVSLSKPDPPPPPPIATGQSGIGSGSTGMFQPISPGEVDRAIAALIMPEPQKELVRRALENNAIKIAWINLSDSEAEDGDWVMITAGAFSQNVRLFKNPLRVTVPYVPGAPIAVTGLIDGDGGGITVAVHSGASTFKLKDLVKGETIQVPSP